jgi:uncharacterized protein YdiU (UPF0061 family)
MTGITTGRWNFDNSYSRLPERFFARVAPEPVREPRLVRANQALGLMLGLDHSFLSAPETVEALAGNRIAEGAEVIAQAYAGHQFGQFVPSLGDGRAVLLGEHITPDGRRVDIQLKGSGRTPFSRRGDGRAALGPMMREYIIGEGLHGLGIPTTRSLGLLTTGEAVVRETSLPGAIVVRAASSHIRIGTFEFFAARQDREALKILADYVIERHYPEAFRSNEPYRELCRLFFLRQASLVAKWLEVGFVHGVLNTDNVSLAGESIDFGPCAFIDTYDSDAVFSSIDTAGRYAFSNQPAIVQWNLARFLETILFLLDVDEKVALTKAQDLLKEFWVTFQAAWMAGMRAKLGLLSESGVDVGLVEQLLTLMQVNKLDYSTTFRDLSRPQPLPAHLAGTPAFAEWHAHWLARVSHEQNGRPVEDSLVSMQRRNPARIPRNFKVEEAITAGVERGDFSVMDRLVEALRDPYTERADLAEYATVPPASWREYRTFCGT